MLENELERIWQNSTKEEVVKFNKSKLIIDLDSQLKSFDRNIKNRDRREIIAAVIIIPAFGIGAFLCPGILTKIGLSMVVLFGILVIYMLRSVRKYKADNFSLPIKEYLLKHRQYLIKERNLLDNVLYWYILPPFIGVILFFIGCKLESYKLIILILIVIAFNAFAYYINKMTVKKDFDPLIKRIDLSIYDLEKIE
jgi:uncharacterized membrane protein